MWVNYILYIAYHLMRDGRKKSSRFWPSGVERLSLDGSRMLYYYCNAPITLNNTSPSQVFQSEEFGMACYTRSSFLKKFPFSSNKKSINEYMNRKINNKQ